LFEVVLGTEASSWKMQIRLFADSNEIEVEHLVDWHEKHKLAKMEFGMNLVSRELVCDTSAGFIRRETHKNTSWQQARFEVCMHKWCDMAESDGGIAILNDGKYGVGVDENHITLSLLRATIRPDITSDMGNVLETVTIPNYPVIAEIKEHMMEHGAAGAMMSGSGPTVFGLFDDKEKAVAAYEAMQASGLAKQVYLTSIYNNMR